MFYETVFTIRNNAPYRYVWESHNKKDSVRPTLVFLHGMFGGIGNYDDVARDFADTYDIFIPQIPYTNSKGLNNVPEMARWLVTELQRFEISDTILVGNSLGGHIALEMALHHNTFVSALVLTGSSGIYEKLKGNTRPRRHDRNYIRELANSTFYSYEISEQALDEIEQTFNNRKELLKMLKIARSVRSYSLKEEMKKITAPSLIIWGKNDEITPPDVGEQFHEHIPGSEIHWIDKCGHSPMMEHPDQFITLMRQFLNQLEVKSKAP